MTATTKTQSAPAAQDVHSAKQYCYDYPRPAVTVDVVVFAYMQDDLHLLLIQRRNDPFAGQWALPGGFVNIDEDLEVAARRELEEETGLRVAHMEQLNAYGAPNRDTRTRVITVAHLALLSGAEPGQQHILAADDAADARWWNVYSLPSLAFDHSQIIADALKHLRRQLERTSLSFLMLPHEFTLSTLQRVYERVLDETLDKRNFRRKFLDMDILEATGNFSTGDHRPARLFRFKHDAEDVALARRRFP